MRRGFMNMYPTGAVGGAGNPQNTKETVPVYSKWDKNSDATISKEEAPWTNSIFSGFHTTKNTITNDQLKEQKKLDEQLQKNNLQSVKIDFNIGEEAHGIFDKAFKKASGSLSNIKKTITIEQTGNQKDNRTELLQKGAAELDNKVEDALKNISANATNMLLNEYQKALNKANETANEKIAKEQAKKADADNNNNNNNGSVDGGKDNTTVSPADKTDPSKLDVGDKVDGVNMGKGKTEVYSIYDNNPTDKRVNYEEMATKFDGKYQDRIKIMTSNEDAMNAAQTIKDKGADEFKQVLKSSFNANIGSKTVKQNKDSLETYKANVAKAKDSLNQKAETAANKALQKANQSVYQTLQQQVNQTIANMMNGVRPEEPAADGKPVDKAGAPQPPRRAPGAPGAGGAAKPTGGGNNLDDKSLSAIFGLGLGMLNGAINGGFEGMAQGAYAGAMSSIGTFGSGGSSGSAGTSDSAAPKDNGITSQKPDWSGCKNADDVVNKVVKDLGKTSATTEQKTKFKQALLSSNSSVFDKTTGKIITGRADNIVLPDTKKYFGA